MRTGITVLLCLCATLAAPAAASAHARTATVALDYRLRLDPAATRIPGVHVAILDGDRSLRVATSGPPVVVLGDLGERMLRIGRDGVSVNAASTTAVAEKLTTPGAGWHRLAGGSSYTWHEHRLAPPPYGAGVERARFTIPLRVDRATARISGTFVREARPSLWPWLLAAAIFAAGVWLAVRAHLSVTTPLGAVAGLAALGSLVAFSVADAPNGRVAWVQLALGLGLAAALYGVLIRSPEPRRPRRRGQPRLARRVPPRRRRLGAAADAQPRGARARVRRRGGGRGHELPHGGPPVILGTPPWLHPWPIGVGPRYQPTAANRLVLAGRPVGPLRCAGGRAFAVHVELFANRKVVIVPRGIGVARSGCTYPVSTREPTGVVHVRGRRMLGDLFRVWGRRLGARRLLSFTGRVSVFVGGKRVGGEPRDVPLTKHGEIVVEVGGYVAPHPSYLFPKGT